MVLRDREERKREGKVIAYTINFIRIPTIIVCPRKGSKLFWVKKGADL